MRQLMRMVAMMIREKRGWTSTWMATRRTGEKGDRNHIESSAENLKMSFPLLITMKVWNIRIFSLYPIKSFNSPFYFGSRGRCLREGWRWGRWGTRRPAWCRHVSHVRHVTVVTAPDGERHAPLQLGVRRRPVLLLVVIIARLNTTTLISSRSRGELATKFREIFPKYLETARNFVGSFIGEQSCWSQEGGYMLSRGVTLR